MQVSFAYNNHLKSATAPVHAKVLISAWLGLLLGNVQTALAGSMHRGNRPHGSKRREHSLKLCRLRNTEANQRG
jgi:hypothetical protein